MSRNPLLLSLCNRPLRPSLALKFLLLALLLNPLSGCFPGTGGVDPTPAPEVVPDEVKPAPPAPDVPPPPPEPAPAPAGDTFGFDVSLPPLFAGKADAAYRKVQLAALARELAAQLEYDGTQPSPIVLTTTDVMAQFQLMNKYALRGAVVAPEGFGAALQAVTTSKLEAGGEGHALAESNAPGETYRETSIKIFKAIAQVLDPAT